jgi:predicted ArsR family transcriptional regulator
MMKTSRQQVLDYVIAQRVVSANDLSRAMQMTEANARHHLHILSEQGLVSVVGRRAAQGKGRPVQLFGLSEGVAGHNLDHLAAALLGELLVGLPEDEQAQMVERLAVRMLNDGERPPGEQQPGRTHLTQRLFQAVRHFNRFNYATRWEAHAIAPHLILGHCPYARIVGEYPELCRLDQFMIEHFVGARVEQIARLQPDRRGAQQCVFAVQDNPYP